MKPSPRSLGTATLTPARPVTAGALVTLRYTYTAGHPIDDTGAVKIAFRFAGDFGVPQFTDPAAENFCTVRTSGHCRIEARFDPKDHTRPWDRTVYLKIMGGYLDTGETITIVFGDRTGGSPGWRMQTFCERTFEFKTLVDPVATYQFRELPVSPTLAIVPGPPARAVCLAPSRVAVGQAFIWHLKLEDAWGNPVRKPARFRHGGFATTGRQTVTATDARSGLGAVSNPIVVSAESVALRPCWADLHGQSEETIGSNTIDEYFTFARDYALVDIAAHQGNDFQIDDTFWAKINRTTRAFNRDGRFVTLPGYEWSGNTPLGGDRNVWFTDEGGPIYRSSLELVTGQRSHWPVARTAADLFRRLRRQTNPAPLVCAHVGGRYADIATHDAKLEFAVEVHSAWGTFEWLVADAFRHGYRVGICANSDGHKGRPGASYPGAGKFGSLGGLTCVLAERLDRAAVVAALRARRFYATTGHRPVIDFSVIDPDRGTTVPMGTIFKIQAKSVTVRLRIAGTAPLEEIQLRNGLKTVHRILPGDSARDSRRIKILWSGAKARGRDRMVSWDGGLQVIGNRITAVTPVNFWHPAKQPEQIGKNRLTWSSTTTGGVAGVIVELHNPHAGSLTITTPRGEIRCSVAELTRDPRVWSQGGIAMQLQAARLPASPAPVEFECDLPVPRLRPGDNPLYLRVVQEDGHLAWTSPVYVER